VVLLPTHPNAGPVVVQELHASLPKNGHDPAKRIRPSAHGAVESFHPLHGPESYPRLAGKLLLRPPDEGARRAYMPAADDDQRTNYHVRAAKPKQRN
jgi:hypothetical protein